MAVSSRLRFEVFKRDSFTCRYCGEQTPKTVLEVDHVIPVSKGGGDEPENLATSCYKCNRGKSAVLLSQTLNVSDIHDQTVMMLERELQLREYNYLRHKIKQREDRDLRELYKYWEQLVGDLQRAPHESSLRMFLKTISKADVKAAMQLAYEKVGYYQAAKYLYGILHNWRTELLKADSA